MNIPYEAIIQGIKLRGGIKGNYYLPKIVKRQYSEYTAFLVKKGTIVLIPTEIVKELEKTANDVKKILAEQEG